MTLFSDCVILFFLFKQSSAILVVLSQLKLKILVYA